MNAPGYVPEISVPDSGGGQPGCEVVIAEAMCTEPVAAWVRCEATGDALATCAGHAVQVARPDPAATVEWLKPEPKPEAEL